MHHRPQTHPLRGMVGLSPQQREKNFGSGFQTAIQLWLQTTERCDGNQNQNRQSSKASMDIQAIMLMYHPKDDSFNPFRMDIEYWDHRPVLTNNGLGITVQIDENVVDLSERIEQDLKLSWQKVVEEYDESKLIFKNLKKVRDNLLKLKKLER